MTEATLDKAVQLKKEMDAAYIVFRKEPTIEHATAWTATTATFNNFCVDTIKGIIDDEQNRHEEILANIEAYKTCKQCGAEVLYPIDDSYVTNINFVDYFPGWCYDCLLEHCLTHECEGCTVTADPSDCPFSEVKKLKSK
jgi:hypothetical protein